MGRQRFGRLEVPRIALVGVLLAVAAVALVVIITASAPASDQTSAPIELWARDATLAGRGITVSGRIVAAPDLSGTVVKIYKREVGESTDTFVADATVSYDNMMSGNTFSAVVPAVTRSCQITATWAGNDDYLASSSWMFAGVRPKLTLAAKTATRRQPKFRFTVSPEQPFYQLPLQKPPFLVDVQCRVRGVWTRFPAELGGAGTDGESWCTYYFYDVKPGKYLVRAHFGGTNYNVEGHSAAQRIVVP